MKSALRSIEKNWTIIISLMSLFIVAILTTWVFFRIISQKNVLLHEIILVVLLTTLIVFINLAVNFGKHWYEIRKTGALVPEEWGSYLRDVSDNIENHVAIATEHTKQNKKIAEFLLKELKNTSDIMLKYSNLIEDKDRKIKELETGSNILIKSSVLERFLRLNLKISSMQSDMSPNTVTTLIMDILAEEGVKQLPVMVGDHIDNYEGLIELDSSTSDTDANNGEITEIVSQGYFLDGPLRPYVMKKAVVNYHYSPDGK